MQHRLRDAEPLPHPQRIAAHLLTDLLGQPHGFDHLVDARAAHAVGARGDLQVVHPGQIAVQLGRFDDRADVADGLFKIRADVQPVDVYLAGVGREQTEDDFDRGRFPRAVRAEEADDLALPDVEADVGEHRSVLKALADSVDGQQHAVCTSFCMQISRPGQKTPQIATITFTKYNIRKKKKKPFFI